MHIIHDSFRKRICPQCGKEFYCYLDKWVYTRSPYGNAKHFFCSWHCLNAWDRERELKRKPRGRKPKNGDTQ